MNDNRMKDMLETIARRGVPEDTDLWPDISARLERNSPMTMALRTRPLVVLLMTLLALLAISSAVYALGRMLGYIPGIGMVEQASPLRSLEAPALVEREGIRLTIVSVIASPTSTSVRFQVEWLTSPPTTGDLDTNCQGTPALILPDGIRLDLVQTADKFTVGEPGSNAGYGYVMEFAPIPNHQSEVTFSVPCLSPIVPGPLPRDWQIPLHLIPAPDGIVLPVVTVPPTELIVAPATVAPLEPTPLAADPGYNITLSIDSYVPTDDGYLLIGSVAWSANDFPAFGVRPIPFMNYLTVTDSTGQPVPWQEVYENVKPQNEESRSYWAIKLLSKAFAAPLTITMNAVDVQIQPVTFHFDVGAAPQAGQSWDINQDIQIAATPAHIGKAHLISSDGNLSFQLDVQVDPDAIGDLHVNTPLTQCMGGGGGYPVDHLSTLQIFVAMCRPDLPSGILEMQVTGAVLWGEWQVNWQP
jgi:hypothetical protein